MTVIRARACVKPWKCPFKYFYLRSSKMSNIWLSTLYLTLTWSRENLSVFIKMNIINFGNFVLPKKICPSPPPKFWVWLRPVFTNQTAGFLNFQILLNEPNTHLSVVLVPKSLRVKCISLIDLPSWNICVREGSQITTCQIFVEGSCAFMCWVFAIVSSDMIRRIFPAGVCRT